MSPNAFLLLFSGFRKSLLTHGKEFLALGFVVRFCKGKFSGSSQDGTCGCEGSHCSLIPLQRLGLEIPLPMPGQHLKGSMATFGSWPLVQNDGKTEPLDVVLCVKHEHVQLEQHCLSSAT